MIIQDQPVADARAAGLRYVSDTQPGIRRIRRGKAFSYVDASGARITDRETRDRIASIAIPPAWTDVWICPDARGHIQATGRDARGRKQYRYHARWRAVRNENKFARMAAFGAALPAIRRRVDRDLARPGLPREKVLAAVVRLLDRSFIRVGNDEYARDNGSYGVTTLRSKHAAVRGASVRLRFVGKSGRKHEIDLEDARLAQVIRRCQELPGQELFGYIAEDGAVRTITSDDVNGYLAEIAGDFTAKDFRTWSGTVLAARALAHLGPAASARAAERNVVSAVDAVAEMLRNTRAVCRSCYVHPGVLDAYRDGTLCAAWAKPVPTRARLRKEEVLVASLLRKLERRAARAPRAAA